MQLLRDEICSEIFKDENKDLHHLLYFGDLLLDPQDWKGLMTQEDDESLHCDLIFVQLAANRFKRKIVLIPIYQPEENDDGLGKNDNIKKKIFTVTPNETETTTPYYMFYFPQGEFGKYPCFQSAFKIEKPISTSQNNSGWLSYEIDEIWHNMVSLKDNETNNEIDEEDDSDDDDHIINKKSNKKDEIQRNPKNMKKDAISHAYNNVTMLTPEDPSASVVINNTNKPMRKKVKNKEPIHVIAPGEGKVCKLIFLSLFG